MLSVKVAALLSTFIFFSIAFSEESITVTTYYPSPYGSYNELTTYSNTYLAFSSGNVGIGTTVPLGLLQVGIAPNVPLIVKANGNVGIGTITPQAKLHVKTAMIGEDNDVIMIEGEGEPNLTIKAASNTSYWNPLIASARARNTLTSPQAVQTGNTIFEIWGMGYDGNSYEAAGQIKIQADDNASNNNMPGQITLGTTPVNGVIPITRMNIKSNGNVGIGDYGIDPSQKLDVDGYVKSRTGLCIGSDCRTSWPNLANCKIYLNGKKLGSDCGTVSVNFNNNWSNWLTCNAVDELRVKVECP